MVESIRSLLGMDIYGIVLLAILFVCLLIQLFFYFSYYNKPLRYANRLDDRFVNESRLPKVSVVITSENESDNLSTNLPYILNQNYPDFEVIVVNKGSTDETDTILTTLQRDYGNLYHTYLPYSPDRAFGLRKLALTLGIKAAKGDVLLFTESYCRPLSDRWIYNMVKGISDDVKVSLGYSYFRKEKSIFNKMASFDNLFFSLKYLSMAIKGKAYNGVYRNVAFAKHLFFDFKGFSSFLHLDNGEDAFINQLVVNNKAEVVVAKESFVETSLYSSQLWLQMKKSYFNVKSSFVQRGQWIFKIEIFSRYIFYLLSISGIVYSALMMQWIILGFFASLFIIRLLFQMIIINRSASYFKCGSFYFSLPFFDFLQPLYDLTFITRPKKKK